MVIDNRGLDGCTYILILGDGTRLEPVDLAESFRKDSLKVMIKYSEVKQPSICMVGRMVNIIEIKVRSE